MTLEAGADFEALVEFLRASRGFDFTGYKRATLVRRVGKRAQELGFNSFAEYLDHLQVHADEFPLLFNTILINVTSFFRDPPAWEHLKTQVLPPLRDTDGPVRVWSAGCATGQEAFSIAILLHDLLGPEEFQRRVKVYATDVDEDALAIARNGYHQRDLEGVPEEFRDKYFEQIGTRVAVRPAVRGAVIFGRHDLIHDAPISRLDLLICRNTLMYFTAEIQTRILARFHHSLKPEGSLFLGRAEMLLTHGALFTPVDLRHRVFSKAPRLELKDRLLLLAHGGLPDLTGQIARQVRVRELVSDASPLAQIVVDGANHLVMANRAARHMFDLSPADVGRPARDLDLYYRPLELASHIERVRRDGQPAVIEGVQFVDADGSPRFLDVQVVPLQGDDNAVLGSAIFYLDVTSTNRLTGQLERSKQDVETAYEELQSSNEELETTNEELQSTVEELETTNEELQSSNEELETMNEELESTNSELQAINSDLRDRTAELDHLNSFMDTVFTSLRVGIAILDADLRIQLWNARAEDLWGLRQAEVVESQFLALDIGLPVDQLTGAIRDIQRGRAPQVSLALEAINRRGRQIPCRITISPLPVDGRQGLLLVMEDASAAESAILTGSPPA